MKKSALSRNMGITTTLVQDFDKFIKKRIDDFKEITNTSEVQEVIQSSNNEFNKITNIPNFLDEQDSKNNFSESFIDSESESLSNELEDIVDFYENVYEHDVIDEIFITNQYGANIAMGIGTSDYRQDDEQWWQIVQQTGFFIGKTIFNENYQAYTLPIGLRINDDTGNFLGVLRISLNLEDILEDMQDDSTILSSENKDIYIVDQSGMIVYSNTSNEFFYGPYQYFEFLIDDIGSFEISDDDELKFISYSTSTGYRDFPGLGWFVIIEQNESSVLADFSDFRYQMIGITMAGVTAAILIGLIVTYLISRSLDKITKIATHLSKGELNYEFGTSRFSEFNLILNSFQKASSAIKQLIVTEKELAETRTKVKNERLTAIGELSSSLAHDLKNPLAVIKTCVDALKKNPSGINPELQKEVFPRMDSAIKRMSHQIDDVLNYVRITPTNINSNSLLEMLESAIKSLDVPDNITIKLPQDDLILECDKEKIEIVLINLILNSIQATGEKTGNIQVSLTKNQNYNIIEIQDSGEGIADDNLKQIFKPLFTTKMKGTGLGLSICKNIIEQHGWIIEAKNNPTRFSIKIPVEQPYVINKE